jgi:hypothetical protein
MTINYLDSKRISALSTSGTGTTVTSSGINDVSHFETAVGLNYVIGEQITGGTLVGKTITSLSFYLYKLSTNSGVADTTFTFGIWNSSGLLQKEFGSVNRSSLPIGSAHGDAVKFTGTATNSGYELQTNDIIGLRTNSNPNDSGEWTVEIGMDTGNTYSDGKRALFVQGSTPSTPHTTRDVPFEAVYDQDIKPTNVEDNSILVDKDTGNRYWFDNTPTFEDDFSGADNWTDDGNDVVVNTGTNVIDWASLADGAEDLTYYDLTSVSDTKWVADFDITFDAVTSGSDTDGTYLVIALDSVTTVPNSSPHDALGIAYELDNTPNNNASIEVFSCDGLNLYDSMELNTPTGTVNVFTETAQASETQYVRMIRNVSTFTVEIYSDTTRETLVESNSVDANDGGTVSGLRYFKIATTRDNIGDHTFNGTIDNVKFYNGVVTTSNEWSEEGT